VLSLKKRRRIKREFTDKRPTIWVGKGGVTPHITDEVHRQLEKKGIVKAKILKSALRDEKTEIVASQIARQTNSSLIEVRGHTFLLYRSRKNT
jgi:RNA-binding protein